MSGKTMELEPQLEVGEPRILQILMILLVLHEHTEIVDVRCRIQKDASDRSEQAPNDPHTGDDELRRTVIFLWRGISHDDIVPQGERSFIGVYSSRVNNSLAQL